MEHLAIIESFGEFKEEKNIDRVTLMSFIEDAFRTQLKKKYGADDNFDVIVNPDKGDLEIWRNRIIVEDDAVALPHHRQRPQRQVRATEHVVGGKPVFLQRRAQDQGIQVGPMVG